MTNPGIHRFVKLDHFTPDERRIIENLSSEWYITNGGGAIRLGATSRYKYFLMRPIDDYKEMFNIDRDIVVIFSSYEDFQSRTLDAYEVVQKKFEMLRLEKICGILISLDVDISSKIRTLLRNEKETIVVVPFYYKELLEYSDEYFIRNRFKNHFYTRDLFAFESPLKKDIYFFGRYDLIHDIVNRHQSNENSGLFGLRKTGKTSVIFATQRYLSKANSCSVFLDCQNPSFHRRRWYESFEYIIDETVKQLKIPKLKLSKMYSEIEAANSFEKDILQIYSAIKKKNILFIFDEIENITFNISPSKHWSDGLDFVYFWQTARSIFQKLQSVFSYLIVGTNPICIETPTIQGKDNPIFSQIPFQYIPRFDIYKTKEMMEKLGKIMGIYFDEVIFGMINEDFGGHPFLIRHVCSVINKKAPTLRPLHVDKGLYNHAKAVFIREYTKFFDMILNVLEEHFPDEFEMLKYLARGDSKTFVETTIKSPEYTNHLIGYGIIEYKNNNYSIRIDAIKDYLTTKEKYKKLSLSLEEKHKEISERRNFLEPLLRKLIRNQIKISMGKKAKETFLKIIPTERREKMDLLSYDELFDGNKNEIYLPDLKTVILKNWDMFKNIFDNDQEGFKKNIDCINKCRMDAHAKNLTDEEMHFFRVCISKLENQLNEFL